MAKTKPKSYSAHPKRKNSRRTIPLTRTMADELTRWKQQQAQDKQRAGDKYTDDGFIVTNEFGHTTLSRKLSRITWTAC